jgi:predicted ATPase with chaperone activity
LLGSHRVRLAESLQQVCRCLGRDERLIGAMPAIPAPQRISSSNDLADVRGQFAAKRALEIAAMTEC